LSPDAFARLNICPKCVCGGGSAPDPTGGAHSAPPDPLAGLGGDRNGRGREKKERDGEAEKGKGREGRRGGGGGRGGPPRLRIAGSFYHPQSALTSVALP